MDFNGMEISPELMEKAKACTSPAELLELAKEEGIQLPDVDLDSITGGWDGSPYICQDLKPLGDERQDIDRSLVDAGFANGRIDARDLD